MNLFPAFHMGRVLLRLGIATVVCQTSLFIEFRCHQKAELFCLSVLHAIFSGVIKFLCTLALVMTLCGIKHTA